MPDTALSTAFRAAGVVRVVPEPASATNTTRACAASALTPGMRWDSRSMAFCDSVPGIENEFDVGPANVAAPTPNPASTTAHSSTTTPRRRNASRPRRYRTVATKDLQKGSPARVAGFHKVSRAARRFASRSANYAVRCVSHHVTRRRGDGTTVGPARPWARAGGRRCAGALRPARRQWNLAADDRRPSRGHEGCRVLPVQGQGGHRPGGAGTGLPDDAGLHRRGRGCAVARRIIGAGHGGARGPDHRAEAGCRRAVP